MAYIIVSAVVFVLVVSIDLFASGFAYGVNKLHVPFCKVLTINTIGIFMIGAGLFAGYYLGAFIPDTIDNLVAFTIIGTLGVINLAKWFLNRKKNDFKVLKSISWKETFTLSIMLSLDGFTTAVGATITTRFIAFILTVIGISIFANHLIFAAGHSLGTRIAKKTNLDLGWLCGIVLVGIATFQLFV